MGMIYPTLELPLVTVPQTEKNVNKIAPLFDYRAGEFVIDGAGRVVMSTGAELHEQWCLKAGQTERYSRAGYSDRYGVEYGGLTGLDAARVKSHIIRTLTEALTVHPLTEYVKGFEFVIEGDILQVKFRVKGKDMREGAVEIDYGI